MAKLYAVIGRAQGWTTPTGAQIVAGVLANGDPAPWKADMSIDDKYPGEVVFSFPQPVSGLQEGVRYNAAVVWAHGASVDSRISVTSFVVPVTGVQTERRIGKKRLIL